MADENHRSPRDGFARLRNAIASDVRKHVDSLRQSGVQFYGYAVMPPDYCTAFDPTTLAVAFNCEADIDPRHRGNAYYRYSVDEWRNYVHEGFDTANRELKSLLEAARETSDDSIDDAFVHSVYQAVLDAMLALRSENAFGDVSYLVIWLSDSSNDILNRSARLLNSEVVYSEFASEFSE